MTINEEIFSYAIFEGLTPEQLEKILQTGQEKNYPTDHVILEQSAKSSAGGGLFVLLKGMVKVELEAQDSQQQTTVNKRVAILKNGDVFGEIGLLQGKTRSARVSAYTDITVQEYDREKLYGLFDQDPRLGYLVMRNLATILADRIVTLNFMWRDDI